MTGLRDRARRAVRAEVAGIGFGLFAEHGFDQVTADQIAAAAGMSRTSFFRYFPTKEDVVLGHLEEMGEELSAALAARPADEGAWVALEQAFFDQFGETLEDPERALRLAKMMQETPALRARHLEKQQKWQELLAPEVARRLRITDDPSDPRARAVTGAALACLDAANVAWMNSKGEKDMRDLIHRVMSTL